MYLEVLEQLESTSGTSAKESIIRQNADDTGLIYILDVALNFYRKFGIKKFSIPAPGSGVGLPAFQSVIARLESRALTGNNAVNAVEELLSKASSLEQKWFSRAILKDLRIGMGISTVCKAGIASIPEFQVMLAKDGKDNKNLNKLISKGVWVSRKYDGYRCLAEVRDFQVTLYTRNGKEYSNFPSIVSAVESLAHIHDMPNFILDGEIMSDNFQAVQKSAFASTRGTTVGDVCYHVFDIIRMDEWSTQKFTDKCSVRYDMLHKVIDTANNQRAKHSLPILPIKEVEHIWTTYLDEVLELERQYASEGYEGAMALNDIPYYLGRKTNALMKFKTMKSMDCTVLGLYEGEGKYVDMMGGLIVQQENGNKCGVGSGFTDQDRSSMWNIDENELLGRVCEVKYQDLSSDGIMRFPIFMRWRDMGTSSGKI